MTDDFANYELSMEELEAIAAGWPGWVHSAVHGIEHAYHWAEGPVKDVVSAAGTVYSAYKAYQFISSIL
jgi:hypothetical protein